MKLPNASAALTACLPPANGTNQLASETSPYASEPTSEASPYASASASEASCCANESISEAYSCTSHSIATLPEPKFIGDVGDCQRSIVEYIANDRKTNGKYRLEVSKRRNPVETGLRYMIVMVLRRHYEQRVNASTAANATVANATVANATVANATVANANATTANADNARTDNATTGNASSTANTVCTTRISNTESAATIQTGTVATCPKPGAAILSDINKLESYCLQMTWREKIAFIYSRWEDFKDILRCTTQERRMLKYYGDIVADLRIDAHALPILRREVDSFRGAIAWFEEKLGLNEKGLSA